MQIHGTSLSYPPHTVRENIRFIRKFRSLEKERNMQLISAVEKTLYALYLTKMFRYQTYLKSLDVK